MAGLLSSFLGGAAGGASVSIVIKAVDEFSKTFNKAEKSVKGMGKEVSGLRLGSIAMAGIVVGGLAAITKASVEAAMQMKPIRDGFERMADPKLLFRLKESTKGLASEFDLMSSANKAMLMGIDQGGLPEMFRQSIIVGQVAGKSVTESIELITEGVGRQSNVMLRQLGIIVDSSKAYEDYKVKIGATGRELTELEKKTAFQIAVQDQLGESAKRVGNDIEIGFNEKVDRLKTKLHDLKVDIGEGVIPIFESLIDVLNSVGSSTKEVTEQLATVAKESIGSGILNDLKALVDIPRVLSGKEAVFGKKREASAEGVDALTKAYKVNAEGTFLSTQSSLDWDDAIGKVTGTQNFQIESLFKLSEGYSKNRAELERLDTSTVSGAKRFLELQKSMQVAEDKVKSMGENVPMLFEKMIASSLTKLQAAVANPLDKKYAALERAKSGTGNMSRLLESDIRRDIKKSGEI